MLDLETLLRVPYVEPDMGFDISPDGTQVAFSWNRTGQWEIYLLPLCGAADPQQLTGGPGGKFNPQWSPDGRRLAYALDLDGSEAYDLYICDLSTDRHVNLTPDTPHANQPNFAWSPDGEQIAFLSDLAGRFDTYVMPASGLMQAPGGEARLVLSTSHPDWEVAWSPCGHWLAVVAEASGQDYWTYIVPAEGGEPRILGTASGPICAKDSQWSPDGTRLAFASDAQGQFEIGLYELATGEIRWLTEGEGDKERPAWASDGSRLACVVGHGPVTELAVLELDGGVAGQYRVAPGVHYRPRFTLHGQRLLLVFDNPGHPCDLWQLDTADGSLRQLTHSLPADLPRRPFAMPEQVRYPSLDGTSVPALLYRPTPGSGPAPGSGPPPAVVYVHGGPNWLTQVTWDPLVQHMVSRGWAVLAPNYRGSTGYGRAWQLASRFDLGGCDTEDVIAGADYLVRGGLADPARIAITGRSWGGYLTMTAMTGYPDRWAGGSAVVPFLNWFTAHANSREDLQHWDRENFGDPERDHELYHKRSPFFSLERIAAPVQMICGAHDVRCPASESVQARDRLLALGKVCELALYEDEGHSFLKIENVIDAKRRQMAFLARILDIIA
jgi:dipeptidyl aminopeptidase/acylaminoacyl peptidase